MTGQLQSHRGPKVEQVLAHLTPDVIHAEKRRRHPERFEPVRPPLPLREFCVRAWHVVEPATRFVPGWHLDAIADHLEAVTRGEIRNLLINMPPRHMKLIADSQPVLTPDGWKTHGELAVGDRVFGVDGRPATIVATSPDGVADLEVVFTNGEVVKCNGDHLWTVYDRRVARWVTRDTASLARTRLWSGGRATFQLPDAAAVEFTDREVALDPEAAGIDATKRYHGPGRTVRTEFRHQGIIGRLRALGLFNNKHIPDAYERGSVAQRLALMAGLIDTDGHCDDRGRIRVSTCLRVLADGMMRVATSLGWRPYLTEFAPPGYARYASPNAMHYHVGFNPIHDIPVVLERKRPRRRAVRRAIGMREIRPAARPENGHCISIDREDGLYLVGESCIPTHNSLSVSVFWPVWVWTFMPEKRWLFSSYAASLSVRDSLKCRRLIESPWFQQRWGEVFALTGDQNAKTRFENDRTGYRIATSVGGSATGEGGDFIIVDDPHSAKEALSEAKRIAALIWWDETMSTRLNDPKTGCRVIVMQRLHQQDLAGHVLGQGGYEHLSLPAEFEPMRFVQGRGLVPEVHVTSIGWTDPREQPGELLWPERFGAPELAEMKKRLGTYAAAGQLQQRPSPAGGGIFQRDWWRLYRELPRRFDMIVLSWDCAFKDLDTSDFVVGQVWGTVGADRYLIEQVRGRMDIVATLRALKAQAERWPAASAKLIEDKANGTAVIALARKHIPGLIAIEPEGGKIARAQAAAPEVEAGNVHLPDPAFVPNSEWVREFIEEHAAFPNGANDDQVDAESQALNWIRLRQYTPTGGGPIGVSERPSAWGVF